MIRLFDVSKSYPGRGLVLDGLQVDVPRGDYVVLEGASGAGKTTLLRIILAAEEPDRGQVMVGGRNIAKLKRSSIPYLRRNIGFVFQDFRLLDDRTVFENVALPLRICGIHGGRLRGRVDALLEMAGLTLQIYRRCGELSGGERQRVAVARALVAKPEILLADEPTGNLDPASTRDLLGILAEARRDGVTILLATHDPAVVTHGRPDRIVRLEGGRAIVVRTAAEAAPEPDHSPGAAAVTTQGWR